MVKSFTQVGYNLVKADLICPICNRKHFVTCRQDGLSAYLALGVPIQQALPELSLVKREKVITGYCSSCLKSMGLGCG